MTPDLATFRAVFPEFAAVPDATVQLWLDEAEEQLSQEAWGRCYGRAALNWAAHNLALALQRAAAADSGEGATASGTIASASAEGLSVSFVAPRDTGANSLWWNQTPYGQAYLAAAAQCLSRGRLSW